jgi:ABC-2 type transport system ATP-binding protein
MTVAPSVAGHELSYRYRQGAVALAGVGFSWPSGVVALLGPNGAGKTTLLRLLTGSLELQGGTVRVGASSEETEVGYLPQQASWPGQFTVSEFVDYLGWARGVPSGLRPERVRDAVAAVGLTDQSQTRLRALSGGQHRRAMLAQALVSDPSVLILDEPTNGFDPVQRAAFRELVAGLADGRCVVISTHLVEDVETIADWVTVLNEGQVAYDGSKDDLLGLDSGSGVASLESQFLRLVR